MTAYVFYDPNLGPEERKIGEFVAQLKQNQVEVKPMEFDSREAVPLRELYDVTNHPALVLARLDGSLVQKWQSELPLVSEVSYLAHS